MLLILLLTATRTKGKPHGFQWNMDYGHKEENIFIEFCIENIS
jgi:hypothetical protein